MTTADVTVERTTRDELTKHREHATCRTALRDQLGVPDGRQVLLRRKRDELALFTLRADDSHLGDGQRTVLVGPTGRDRLGRGDRFEATIDTTVIDPAATEAEARAGRALLERLVDDDNDGPAGLVIVAPHGGAIEARTDDQALLAQAALADLGAVCWYCQGWRPGGGAAERWHITSTDIATDSFPLLQSIAGRGFTHAVSFHGFDIDGRRPDIVVGGGAPAALKAVMAAMVAEAVTGRGLSVGLASEGDPRGGAERRNLVNRLTASGGNGVQIEQQRRARDEAWADIASAVAVAYRAVLGA